MGALSEILNIRPGATAVIGSGGKTTLLRSVGEELAGEGQRVILCTTTHILPFPGLPLAESAENARKLLSSESLICVGTKEPETGKLTGPACAMRDLLEMADYVLVEADGAARRPLKAHAPHEPVIPKEAGQTICVVGLSGLGREICEAVHRPEIFSRLTGEPVTAPVSFSVLAAALRQEALGDRFFLNQADTPERWEWGRELAQLLDRPCIVGALQKGMYGAC